MNMKFKHESVLLDEIIQMLDPQPNQNFIDATLGGGGHAKEILKRTVPNGKLLGIDLDQKSIYFNQENYLKEFTKRIILVNKNFFYLKSIVQDNEFENIDGILFDLGFSTELIKKSGKGMSFEKDEFLDMRFDPETHLTAQQIVNKWKQNDIETILRQNAEERFARQIAKNIVQYRKNKPINTTFQLNNIIEQSVPKRFWPKKINVATKTYQALRITVNNELENLKTVLNDSLQILNPCGKIAVISFHSLEDRIVKKFFKKMAQKCTCPPEIPVCVCENKPKLKILTKKPIIPSQKEIENNPKSRSAKLRVAQKL